MSKRVAFSSVMTALAVVCLFAASVAPSAKIALLAVSSVFGSVCTAEYGPKYGLLHYAGVALLSLLLIPKKTYALAYIVLLGYYPVIKMYIEKLNKRWLEWALKILLFNVVLVAAYLVFQVFFLPTVESAVTKLTLTYLPWIVLALEVIFILYDYVLSYIITYYYKVLQKKMRRGGWI